MNSLQLKQPCKVFFRPSWTTYRSIVQDLSCHGYHNTHTTLPGAVYQFTHCGKAVILVVMSWLGLGTNSTWEDKDKMIMVKINTSSKFKDVVAVMLVLFRAKVPG